MGWVWVSCLLLGLALSPFTRLLLPHMLLLGILLPHTRLIPLRLPLLTLRPILLPMRMSASLMMTTVCLTLPLLPCPWIQLAQSIAACLTIFADCSCMRRVCLLLLLLRAHYLNRSLLRLLRLRLRLTLIGLTVCERLLWMLMVVLLLYWLLAVPNAYSCPNGWPRIRFEVTVRLAVLFLSTSLCWLISTVLFSLTYRWGLPFAMLWRLRPHSGRSLRLSLTPCGYCQVYWGLCVCRTSPRLILRFSVNSLLLFPRASPIRPPTLLFSAIVAVSFTSLTFRRILVM